MASAAALLTLLASISPAAAAAPDRFTFETHELFAFFSSLPPGQLGTADYVQVVAGTVIATNNGIVTEEGEFLSLSVGQVAIGEGGDVSTIWGGGYLRGNPRVVAGPRDLKGNGTLTWTCFAGACPAMPATVTVEIVATADGAPTTFVENYASIGNVGRVHVLSQRRSAIVTVDTGGVLALPAYAEPFLRHRTSRVLIK